MRISDWSSDVCSSDLVYPLDDYTLLCGADKQGLFLYDRRTNVFKPYPTINADGIPDYLSDYIYSIDRSGQQVALGTYQGVLLLDLQTRKLGPLLDSAGRHVSANNWVRKVRSEEHTSELQSLMRISYAVL